MEAFHKRRLENYSWRAMTNCSNVLRRAKNKGACSSSTLNLKHLSVEPEEDGDRVHRSKEGTLKETPRGSPRQTANVPKGRKRSLSVPTPHYSIHNTVTPSHQSRNTENYHFETYDMKEVRNPPRKTQIRSPIKRKPSFQYGIAHAFERGEGEIGKGSVCIEYGDQGTGGFRSPSFIVSDNFDGSTISPLKYRKHKIYRGKLPMPDEQPSIRCSDENQASTLVITMGDVGSGLEVDLVYGKCHCFLHVGTT